MRRAVIWILRVLLAVTFGLSASGKLDPGGNIAEAFQRWGYSIPMMMAIGVVEMAASIALLIPKFTTPACVTLVLVMCGSIVTHFTHFEEMGWPLLPLILISLLAIVYSFTRPQAR